MTEQASTPSNRPWRPLRPAPKGQLSLDLPGIPRDARDIRPGIHVVFTAHPWKGRFAVVEATEHLVTIMTHRGRSIEVRRTKLSAVQ